MSELVGTTLPTSLVEQLQETPPPLRAVPVVTTDEQGLPHIALLSLNELILLKSRLYFFVSSSSRSASLLENSGRCTLLFLSRGSVYYVKGEATPAAEVASRQVFRLNVLAVLQDFPESDEAEAGLLSGLNFATSPQQLQRRIGLREEVKRRIDQ